MKWLRPTWSVFKKCAELLGDTLLWAIWLCLGALLAIQIAIASSHQLRVPTRIVQSFEDRLAVSGLRIKFDSASFDPSGRILVENLQVFAESFDEPLAVCHSLLLQLDPWLVPLGMIKVDTVSGRGLNLLVPAMLSPSGSSEPLLADANFSLRFTADGIELEQLVGHLGELAFSCAGRIHPPVQRRRPSADREAAVSLAIKDYLHLAQEVAGWQTKLAAFEEPSLRLALWPDAKHWAKVDAVFSARSAALSGDALSLPHFKEKIKLAGLRVSTQLPLVLAPRAALPVKIELADATVGGEDIAHEVHAKFLAEVTTLPANISVQEVDLAAENISSRGVRVDDLSAHLLSSRWPRMEARISIRTADQSWGIRAEGNPMTREGRVALEGRVSEEMLHQIGRKSGHPMEELLTLSTPAPLEAQVLFEQGGKLGPVSARFDARDVIVREILLRRAAARVSFVGHALSVDEAQLDQGANQASGSYTMDTSTLDYRFLLKGKITPLAIAGWFHGWWERFWSRFEFPIAGPVADVDVLGRWHEPYRSIVFVFADCDHPVIRSVPFDRVRTVLFIRPDYYDGLEIFASRGAGTARGTFTRSVDLDRNGFRWMDFSVQSTLDLQESARLFGTEGTEIVEPFVFDRPPKLKLSGRLEGEASDQGEHHRVALEVESAGPFRFFNFPLSDLKAKGTVVDHNILLPQVKVGFAGGTATGRASVEGRGDQRRLSFETHLKSVSFGQAIRTLEEFSASRHGEKAKAASAFQNKVAAGKLELQAKAEGFYQDPYSFEGVGSADLKGAELAQINLLGALSEALRSSSALSFTTWRLDTAHSQFTIEKDKLNFSEVKITGPTAKLEAHGSYALEHQLINFHAKFYPFDQGKTLLAGAIDLMLAPVSKVLELKLTGDLSQPKWFFEFGPTNFLRKLAGSEDKGESPGTVAKQEPPPLLRR